MVERDRRLSRPFSAAPATNIPSTQPHVPTVADQMTDAEQGGGLISRVDESTKMKNTFVCDGTSVESTVMATPLHIAPQRPQSAPHHGVRSRLQRTNPKLWPQDSPASQPSQSDTSQKSSGASSTCSVEARFRELRTTTDDKVMLKSANAKEGIANATRLEEFEQELQTIFQFNSLLSDAAIELEKLGHSLPMAITDELAATLEHSEEASLSNFLLFRLAAGLEQDNEEVEKRQGPGFHAHDVTEESANVAKAEDAAIQNETLSSVGIHGKIAHETECTNENEDEQDFKRGKEDVSGDEGNDTLGRLPEGRLSVQAKRAIPEIFTYFTDVRTRSPNGSRLDFPLFSPMRRVRPVWSSAAHGANVCVYVCACVCVRVSVCVRERKRECVCVRERKSVCVCV